jgi:hypothetical protein
MGICGITGRNFVSRESLKEKEKRLTKILNELLIEHRRKPCSKKCICHKMEEILLKED